MKIRKVIIPVAGNATRMFPETLGISKTMLPIGKKPAIQYILEECREAGIEEVILVMNYGSQDLIKFLSLNKNKSIVNKYKDNADVNELISLLNCFKFHFLFQQERSGLAGAIALAKNIIQHEDFAVILGDNPILTNYKNGILNIIKRYRKTGFSYIGLKEVSDEEVSKYGMVTVKSGLKVIDIQEKPEKYNTNTAIMGRYVFTNNILDVLAKQIENYSDKEINLTEGLKYLITSNSLKGVVLLADIMDVGNEEDYLNTIKKYIELKEGNLC